MFPWSEYAKNFKAIDNKTSYQRRFFETKFELDEKVYQNETKLPKNCTISERFER